MVSNYFKYPTGTKNNLYIVSHQRLFHWDGSQLKSLCSFNSDVRQIKLSPDGLKLSIVLREESNGDIYIYDLKDTVRRATFLNDSKINNIGWSVDGEIIYSSGAENPFDTPTIYKGNRKIREGCVSVTYSDNIEVIQRYGYGYARWRNYKGGCAARLMYSKNSNNFEEMNLPMNNCYSPVFLNGKLFFLSDCCENHVSNIYEYNFESSTYAQKTFHKDFFVRNLNIFGDSLIYSTGGDIYTYSPELGVNKVEINGIDYTYSCQKTLSSMSLSHTDCAVSDDGSGVAIANRGHIFHFKRYFNTLKQCTNDIRYRLVDFLDKNHIVCIKDDKFASWIEFHNIETGEVEKRHIDYGLIRSLVVISDKKLVLITYNCEILLFEKDGDTVLIDKDNGGRNDWVSVSPCKKWIAYTKFEHFEDYKNSIYLYNIEEGRSHRVVRDDFYNYSPIFSKNGNYLHFLSLRLIKTEYSEAVFDMYLKMKSTVFTLCLNDKAPHPFRPWIKAEKENTAENKIEEGLYQPQSVIFDTTQDHGSNKIYCKSPNEIRLYTDYDSEQDFNSEQSISKNEECGSKDHESSKVAESDKKNDQSFSEIMPDKAYCIQSSVPYGHYIKLRESSSGKLMILTGGKKKILKCFDIDSNEFSVIQEGIEDFELSHNREYLYTNGSKLRVGKCDSQFDDKDRSYKNSGWCNLDNHKVRIDKSDEWGNILEQVWYWMYKKFWNQSLLKNWDSVLEKYRALLPRIRSREDLNYIIEEMIGELRTSHGYIFDFGDNGLKKYSPPYSLCCTLEWDNGYKVIELPKYKDTNGLNASPLLDYGLDVCVGDRIVAVNGTNCSADMSVDSMIHAAQTNITILKEDGTKRDIFVNASQNIKLYKYNRWVEGGSNFVSEQTNARVGYIHIPNMTSWGYREFWRQYRNVYYKDAIIVDLRYNGGGNVSQLIIRELRNVQNGICVTPTYKSSQPHHSNKGKFVFLCNQKCGSDGDLFIYEVKRSKMGTVVGKRTWGGTVGICPDLDFVDGTLITVPEYGEQNLDNYQTENYGVEPDIEVENLLEDGNYDRQLDTAINLALQMI